MKTAREILNQLTNNGEKQLTEEIAIQAMDAYLLQLTHVHVELREVLLEICENLHVNYTEVVSPLRNRELTDARAIFCRRVKEIYPVTTWRVIGEIIGRDHASAMPAARRAELLKDINDIYMKLYAKKTSFYYTIMASGSCQTDGKAKPEGKGSILP
jgi:chromosomal replication initiation ATPase DnaA